jgi:hypothetical protein
MIELSEILKASYRESHETLLKMVADLTDTQMAWRPTATAHNIAFQAWHAARTAEDIQSALRRASPSARGRLGAGEQLWFAEGLARRWGFNPSDLGADESGYEMDDAVAARLTFPRKEQVLDYVRRAFAAAEQMLDAAKEDWTTFRYKHWGQEVPLWQHVMDYISHNHWNIGYIAALRRAQNLRRVIA